MDIKIFVALAPALASILMCGLVEGGPLLKRLVGGRVLPALRAFRERFLKDRILLELVAETTVHLSTYGSIVVGWVVHHLVGDEPGYIFTASVAIVWFTAMLYISYWARKLLEDLPEDEDK